MTTEDSTDNMPDIPHEIHIRYYLNEDYMQVIQCYSLNPVGEFECSVKYYSQAELDRRVADHYSDGYLSEDEVIGLLGKLTDAMGRNVDDFDSDAGFLGCCERLVDSAVEYIAEAEERQREYIKSEILASVSVLFRPHIEGVFAVIEQKLSAKPDNAGGQGDE